MSEVKRWNVTNENALWAADDGRFVKASDYDALAAVCRELISEGDAHHESRWPCDNECDWEQLKAKALALLGGEKGVGT